VDLRDGAKKPARRRRYEERESRDRCRMFCSPNMDSREKSGLMNGVNGVEFEVELQDIDAGFAEEAELAGFRVLDD
jgi:hypothetical protein